MATVTLKGNPVNTSGDLPSAGTAAPDFKLTRTDLSHATLGEFRGQKVVLNIFPSVDTGTCSASVRRFNSELADLENTVVLCVSRDLPFAHARFCEAEGIENVIPLSDFSDRSFGQSYGVEITNGPLAGLLARAVVIIDEKGAVTYNQLVDEITEAPDYNSALAAITRSDASEAAEGSGDSAKGGEPLGVCTSSFSAEDSRSDEFEEPCDDGRSG
jgi:thioredoxin-dependent peroxiredoxin